MKTIQLLVQYSVQGYLEVEVPEAEELMLGAQPEVRLDPSRARSSVLVGHITPDGLSSDKLTFASQMAYDALSAAHQAQVRSGLREMIETRQREVAPTLVQAKGDA